MNSERYQKIYDIFSEAAELPPARRANFLAQACGADEELRSEVESFLESEENLGDFIETPALEVAAKILSDEQAIAKIGQQIGHYKIISLLGAGGMGEVWLAEDTRLKRQVALKLLSAVHRADLLARFEQEARAVSALNHPNIITIFDIGQSGGWEYIATEYINGKTLRQLMTESALDLRKTLEIAAQIGAALAAAHSAGIIHRDIKPENIMIRRDGIVKVLDFGLARFSDEKIANLNEKLKTAPGMVMGTVTYMSPEQARGLLVEEKTDVFSLGIVLYEMLSGKQPFEGDSGMDVLAAILRNEPLPLGESFPEQLRVIVRRALEKDASKRPSAAEILSDFESFNRSGEFFVDAGNRAVSHRSGSQTVGVNALTDKNSRRRTDNFAALGGSNRPPVYKVAAVLLILLSLSVAGLVFYRNRSNVSAAAILTENDPLLVADFENKTGDQDFGDKVFDQSIYIGLHQSPYLALTNYNDIAEKLKELGQTETAPLTNDIAVEIGRRLDRKAVLKGAIENDGSKYRIVFEAVNPATGESLAKSQAQADGKETVIDALSTALTAMRGKLGEPPDSVAQFSVPLRTAASSSLPALKLFGLAAKAEYEGKHDDAIILYKRAVEADPDYAIAYYSLALIYSNDGQEKAAKEHLTKCFALRDRLTARDKPEIVNFYYSYVTGEAEKEIEGFEIAKKTYPRDYPIPINLGAAYLAIGDVMRAEENFRAALKIIPNSITPRIYLGDSLTRQSRFEEAKAVYREAGTLGADSVRTDPGLWTAAFALDNQAEMRQRLDSLKKADEMQALLLESGTLIYAGKAAEYLKLMNRAIDRAAKDSPETAGKYAAQAAVNLAALGQCTEAGNWTQRALHFDREPAVLTSAALVFAICDDNSVSSITDELENNYPRHMYVKNIWLSVIRAARMKESPEKALEALEENRRYETVTAFWGNYLRGKIYLQVNKPDSAAKEFRKILENRGWAVESPLYVLAHRQAARAAQLQNDAENAKKHSAQFAALWKNADRDLPVLKEFQKKSGVSAGQ